MNFSPLQACWRGKWGPPTLILSGRLDAAGHDGVELVRQTKTIYLGYGYNTQIIAAAMRHPTHVLQAALTGSDVATMGFDILEQLYKHPLTVLLTDWANIADK